MVSRRGACVVVGKADGEVMHLHAPFLDAPAFPPALPSSPQSPLARLRNLKDLKDLKNLKNLKNLKDLRLDSVPVSPLERHLRL